MKTWIKRISKIWVTRLSTTTRLLTSLTISAGALLTFAGCAGIQKLVESGGEAIEVIPVETAGTITEIASGGADVLSAIAAGGGGIAGLLAGGFALFKLITRIISKRNEKKEKDALITEVMKRVKSGEA